MPLTNEHATPVGLRGPAAAVARALEGIEPRVWMWRDGLTVIALDSGLSDRKPDYLTFEEAASGGAVEVREAPAQEVPTAEAVTGAVPVLLLGGDTIIDGRRQRCLIR